MFRPGGATWRVPWRQSFVHHLPFTGRSKEPEQGSRAIPSDQAVGAHLWRVGRRKLPVAGTFLPSSVPYVRNDAPMRQARGAGRGVWGTSASPLPVKGQGMPQTLVVAASMLAGSHGAMDHDAPVRLTIGIAAFRAIAAAVTEAEIGGEVPSVTISQLRPDLELWRAPSAWS